MPAGKAGRQFASFSPGGMSFPPPSTSAASCLNPGIDKVRAEETGRMKREGRDPVLNKSRWLLLKRSENLEDEQHFRQRGV